MTLSDIEPHLDMWHAALQLYLDDARQYLTSGDDKEGNRGCAYRDITGDGRMLNHLCKHALVEPAFVKRTWNRVLLTAA